jgi:tetratricopeptide (TPR) repeat protein
MVAVPSAWFEAERANIVAAIGYAAALGLSSHAWELADAALGFYEMRDLREDWTTSHETALGVCRGQSDALGSAVMARNLAYLASAGHVCDIAKMEVHATSAHALFAAIGDIRGQADALVLLGEVQREAGVQKPAAALFLDAVKLAQAGGYKLAESVAHNEIAQLHHEAGNNADATRYYRRSLYLCAQHGNVRPRYVALRGLGRTEIRQGRLDEGEALLQEALSLAQSMKSPIKQARVLREVGGVQLDRGRLDLAAASIQEAYTITDVAADRFEQAFVLRWLGLLALAQGHPHEARHNLTEALHTFERGALTYPTALILRDLGTASLACQDQPGARGYWEAARALYVKLSNTKAVAGIDVLCAGLTTVPDGRPGSGGIRPHA